MGATLMTYSHVTVLAHCVSPHALSTCPLRQARFTDITKMPLPFTLLTKSTPLAIFLMPQKATRGGGIDSLWNSNSIHIQKLSSLPLTPNFLSLKSDTYTHFLSPRVFFSFATVSAQIW